jgi:hypothetical protein
MLKKKGPRQTTAPRARRARLLAPAALAALLTAGGDASADGDAGASDEDIAALASPTRLARLAEHPDRARRIRLAGLLPEILLLMEPIARTEIVASWATARSPHLRLAIAKALRYLSARPPTLGALTAIEHLAADPDPSVRAVIAEAAWLRRREDPARLLAVLHHLAEDGNLFVQEVARLALGDPWAARG